MTAFCRVGGPKSGPPNRPFWSDSFVMGADDEGAHRERHRDQPDRPARAGAVRIVGGGDRVESGLPPGDVPVEMRGADRVAASRQTVAVDDADPARADAPPAGRRTVL